jgi:hypothetical protein
LLRPAARPVPAGVQQRVRKPGCVPKPGIPLGRLYGGPSSAGWSRCRRSLMQDIRLLVDHRERLVRMRTAINNDLLWHLHDLWPEQTLPGSALLSKK